MVVSPTSPHAMVDITVMFYPELAYKLEKGLTYQPKGLCVNPRVVSK